MKKEWTNKAAIFLASLLLIPTSTIAHAEPINSSPISQTIVSESKTTEIKTEPVKFDTRVIKDKDLPEGIRIVTQKGKEGEKTFYKALDIATDSQGKTTSFPIYYDEVTTLPTEKVIREGLNKEVIDGVSDKTKKLEDKKQEEKIQKAKKKAEDKAKKELEKKVQEDSESNESTITPREVPALPAEDPSGSSSNNSGNENVSDKTPAGHVTTPAENKAYAKSILSPQQFECANKLIMRESEWITTADNPYSSAYGLPQALPGSKMASAGADWRTNGKTQFKWMQGYVKERYQNSFCVALNHSYNKGWY